MPKHTSPETLDNENEMFELAKKVSERLIKKLMKAADKLPDIYKFEPAVFTNVVLGIIAAGNAATAQDYNFCQECIAEAFIFGFVKKCEEMGTEELVPPTRTAPEDDKDTKH